MSNWPDLYEIIGRDPFESPANTLLRVAIARCEDGRVFDETLIQSYMGECWRPPWAQMHSFAPTSGCIAVTVTRPADGRTWRGSVDWVHPSDAEPAPTEEA